MRKPNRVQIHGRRSLQSYKSEINLMDTRGQILLNSNEKKQMELLLDGRVKHMSTVKQRTYRYSYLLWEFWRQDHELFPSEILENNLSNHPHCIVLVFDGSLEQVPNGDEETQFYREILNEMDRRGYGVPQVVLTHLDQSDQSVEAEYMETIDKKINSVVQRLRIPRRNVHFIENYHEKVKDYIPVNYYALKLLE